MGCSTQQGASSFGTLKLAAALELLFAFQNILGLLLLFFAGTWGWQGVQMPEGFAVGSRNVEVLPKPKPKSLTPRRYAAHKISGMRCRGLGFRV